MAADHDPIHPGELLLEEFLNPLGISQNRLATAIGVTPRLINEIVHGVRSITPDIALRMSRALGTSDRFWINVQICHDFDRQIDEHGEDLDRIIRMVD